MDYEGMSDAPYMFQSVASENEYLKIKHVLIFSISIYTCSCTGMRMNIYNMNCFVLVKD